MFGFVGVKPFVIEFSVFQIIKVETKARGGECEQVIPSRRRCVGIVGSRVSGVIGGNGDGREPIVKHNVKLRRNGQCSNVEDEWDAGSMGTAEAHEDTAAGARLPTRNFLAVLKAGIKDVGGASPDVKVNELLAGNAGASDDIYWSDAGLAIGAMVVNEDGVIDGHWPMG